MTAGQKHKAVASFYFPDVLTLGLLAWFCCSARAMLTMQLL